MSTKPEKPNPQKTCAPGQAPKGPAPTPGPRPAPTKPAQPPKK